MARGRQGGGRTRWKRPFPSRVPPGRPSRAGGPASVLAVPAARAGGLPAPDRAGPPRAWAPPGTPWQGLRQAGSVGRAGRPQAWAPAGAGWQGVGGRGRVGLREKWLYFSYTLHDGARYHTSAATQAFLAAHRDRITEHPLPSYSPDYNPIEYLWRKTKKRATHNKYFKEFAAVVVSVDKALAYFAAHPEMVLELFGLYCKESAFELKQAA